MRYLLLGGAVLAIIGYAWFGRGEANVDAMSAAEAYARLRAAPIPADKTAFGRLDDARQPDGSYAGAVGGALKLEREMHQLGKDMEKRGAKFEEDLAHAQAHSGVQFQPGQPMVNVNPAAR